MGIVALYGLIVWLVTSPAVAAAEEALKAKAQSGHLEVLSQANEYFRQAGDPQNSAQSRQLYEKALVRFEKLVKDGVENGQLFYNIGNTYFRLNDLGRAILNYRRAQQYMPDDENLRQNLAFARSRQMDKIELDQDEQIIKTLLFWHFDLSFQVRLICFAVLNTLFWGLLGLRYYKKEAAPGPAVIFSLIFALLFGGSVLHAKTIGVKPGGVLTAPEVTARKGDGLAYSPSFQAPLHAGLDFKLVEERGDWLHIELTDGRTCWVPKASAELI